MGGIPLLSDIKMKALRRVIDATPKSDLTIAPKGKTKKFPTYENNQSAFEYFGFFKLILEKQEGNGIWNVKCIDGAEPENEYCGICDVGQCRKYVKCIKKNLDNKSGIVWLLIPISNGEIKDPILCYGREMPQQGVWPNDQNVLPPNELDNVIHIFLGRAWYNPENQGYSLSQEHFGAIQINIPNFCSSFAVKIKNGALEVNGGYAYCNGTMITVKKKTLSLQSGIICVHAELKNKIWTEPEILFANPDKLFFPIAKVDKLPDGNFKIEHSQLFAAILLETKICPIKEYMENT